VGVALAGSPSCVSLFRLVILKHKDYCVLITFGVLYIGKGRSSNLANHQREVEMLDLEPKDPMLMSPAEYMEWQEQEEEDFARRDQMEAGLLIEGDAEEAMDAEVCRNFVLQASEEEYLGAYGWYDWREHLDVRTASPEVMADLHEAGTISDNEYMAYKIGWNKKQEG